MHGARLDAAHLVGARSGVVLGAALGLRGDVVLGVLTLPHKRQVESAHDGLNGLGISTRDFARLGQQDQRAILKSATLTESSGRKKRTHRKQRQDDVRTAIRSEHPIFFPIRCDDQQEETDNATLRKRIAKIPKLPGHYDVHAHGTRKTIECFHSDIDAKTLAYILQSRSDYHGEPVRLFCCNTGKRDENGNCFAQELADILGVGVMAPPHTTTIEEDGTFFFKVKGYNLFEHFEPRKEDSR